MTENVVNSYNDNMYNRTHPHNANLTCNPRESLNYHVVQQIPAKEDISPKKTIN